MQFVATQKFTRQSPRKVRLVANQVKDLALPEMLQQLAVVERKASLVLLKTIKQAIANAQNNHQVAFDQLELDQLIVNEGPTYKRYQAVSRGRGHSIMKRTSHVKVILKTKEKEEKVAKAAKQEETKEVVKKEIKPKVAKKATIKKATTKKK